MAESLSTVYKDEDFYCPVCQEVLKNPVETISCRHTFCRKCFLTAIQMSGYHCPLCRSLLKKKELYAPKRNNNIACEMRKRFGHCKYCRKLVKYSAMRQHYKGCWEYQQEYGSDNDKNHYKSILFEDSAGNSNRTETDSSTQSSSADDFEGNSTPQTYNCSMCLESSLDRRRLLDHYNNQHGIQSIPVVCPICATMPWSNQNRLWSNIVEHLNTRHQFDYGAFVNFHQDEETQYQNAVEDSTNTTT